MNAASISKRISQLEHVSIANKPQVNIFIYQPGFDEDAQLEAAAKAAHPGQTIFFIPDNGRDPKV